MRWFLFLFLISSLQNLSAQTSTSSGSGNGEELHRDSIIKDRLVFLALENPTMAQASALVGTAENELKRAKSSWLNAINLSGNVNELVINNTTINGLPASTLYPKYNIGVVVPLGIFGRKEKAIANEKLNLYLAQREERALNLKKLVLVRYEEFKEKKELLELQKQLTDGQLGTYQQKQREFAEGEINDINDVNKEYQLYLEQKLKLRTKEKEFNVAKLELEELIGMTFEDATNSLVFN